MPLGGLGGISVTNNTMPQAFRRSHTCTSGHRSAQLKSERSENLGELAFIIPRAGISVLAWEFIIIFVSLAPPPHPISVAGMKVVGQLALCQGYSCIYKSAFIPRQVGEHTRSLKARAPNLQDSRILRALYLLRYLLGNVSSLFAKRGRWMTAPGVGQYRFEHLPESALDRVSYILLKSQGSTEILWIRP